MWQIARPEKDESVIEFFANQGVYNREMFDILLRRGIKEHNIETILEALSGQPSMSIISENEHDICKMHILKWPELDIFDLFLKSGLDSLRVNRIRNRLGFYANIMLKETLVENFGEREFQYAEKAFEVSILTWVKALHQRYPLHFGKFRYWLITATRIILKVGLWSQLSINKIKNKPTAFRTNFNLYGTLHEFESRNIIF